MSVVKGSSEDFFRSLTTGARFNKSKNDVAMFSRTKKPEKHTIKTMSTKQNDKEIHYKAPKKKANSKLEAKLPSKLDNDENEDEYDDDDDFIEEEENESETEQISLFGTTNLKEEVAAATTTAKSQIKPTTSTKTPKESKKQQKTKSNLTSILLTQMNLAPKYQAQIESIERVHRSNGIKVSGNDIVAPIEHFSELRDRLPGIDPRVLRNLKRFAIEEPSPIQMQAIPSMGLGREVIGVAPTGSGKTLAYVLPLIHLLTSHPQIQTEKPSKIEKSIEKTIKSSEKIIFKPAEGKRGYRSIILSPTRELAQQIYRVFKRYCQGIRLRVCLLTRGIMDKKATLPKGAFDVLVATPMRLVNMIKDGSVDLTAVQTLVLDEADRLFDEQFVAQIDEIAAACKEAREAAKSGAAESSLQVCLFSATMLPQVEQLAASIMRDPVRILVGHRNVPLRSIKQSLVFVGNEEGKLLKMVTMVREGAIKVPCLVFVQSKERGTELRKLLTANGVRNVRDINSDKSESERAHIVDNFRVGKIWFLISTEIMARGMDFPGICTVVNYDFPQSNASYVHRVGRTGRGTSVDGVAYTFFTESDAGFLRTIANSVKAAGCEVPDWMLELKPLEKAQRKKLERVAPKRFNVGGVVDKRKKPAGSFTLPLKYSKLSESEKGLVVVGWRGRQNKKRDEAMKKRLIELHEKGEAGNGDNDDDDDEGWQVVGKNGVIKNKGVVGKKDNNNYDDDDNDDDDDGMNDIDEDEE